MPNFHHIASVDAKDGPMPMYIAAPEGHGPHPTVLVIQGMHGANSFEFNVAERLADHGFLGAVPDLFHRGPGCFSGEELDRRRRGFNDAQVIWDVNGAIAYLQAQPFVQGDQLAIMGFCMGGRVSYMIATQRPDLRAAADFYGGGVHNGEGGPSPFEMTANIRCPVIIFDGEQDEHPSPEEVRKTEAELARHGKVHEVHIYPGVGHAFMSASGSRAKIEVQDDAWSRLMGWFDRYLVAEPVAARS